MARDALNMRQEVVSLCDQVERFGYRSSDGTEQITFGELAKINELISGRFACILESAQKYRLMQFPGKSLSKGKDDNIIISLSRKNREIQQYFCHTKHLLPNNPEGNLWIDIDCDRRAHYAWVTHVRQVSSDKASYHVQCDMAEDDEVTETWQTCFPFGTEEEVRIEATCLVEPMVIFKLLIVTVHTPIVVCDPVEHCENSPIDEVKDSIDQLVYMHASENLSTNTYDTATEVIRVDTKNCPANTEKKERKCIHMEIRPLVRLYRKHSPSPPPQPTYRKSEHLKTSLSNTRKASIKFSTSTALYTPAKPGYDNLAKYEAPRYNPKLAGSSLFSSYSHSLPARARSEFRERSIGRRSYLSLYH